MAGSSAEVALVSRQPIYDRHTRVFAYELLYRNQFNTSENTDGDLSTAEVLRNTFLEIGLDRLVGESRAFVNLTRSFVLGDYCSSLPPDRVVLEVLEDVAPDEDVVQALSRLSAEGYKIALDDFVYSDDKLPLVRLADYIKIDFRLSHPEEIPGIVSRLKQYKALLLAEKVETHEEFEAARKSGFDYFQGYFFCQPKTLKVNRIPLNRLTTLRVVARLRDAEATTSELEELIRQDIAISYNLLRYVNSASLSLARPVESVAHAIQMVGRRQIRTWASLLLLSTFEDKPRELTVTALIRGGMTELLAMKRKLPHPESYFTVGLFSVLDALLDRPMSQAIELLPFNEDIRCALLRREGTMGSVLNCVLAYEAGRWNDVQCGDLTSNTIREAYLASLEAAAELTRPVPAIQ
jgi:EAL and modified HD-GYP domain-containing signal transduction protein